MTTTLIPLDPATSPQRSTRILTISANLLPDEIVAARQARRTRGWVIVAVALVACLCAGWFAYALHQKQEADKALTASATTVIDLQRDQREFSETVRVQSDTALLTKQLTAVMANDLDWATLLATLRSTGTPSRIAIVGVNGTLAVAADTASTAGALAGTDTVTSVGSLVVTGTGPDKKAVAAYVDALGKQPLLTNPFVTSVASDQNGGVTFSLKVDITSTALCGRFTVKCIGGN